MMTYASVILSKTKRPWKGKSKFISKLKQIESIAKQRPYSSRSGIPSPIDGSTIWDVFLKLDGYVWHFDYANDFIMKHNAKPDAEFFKWVHNFDIEKYIEQKTAFKSELKILPVKELRKIAKSVQLDNYYKLKKQDLIVAIVMHKFTDTIPI